MHLCAYSIYLQLRKCIYALHYVRYRPLGIIVHMCKCMYIYVLVGMYVCNYVCMYMGVCTYECMYVYICMYV